jgi:hypothetical protein
MTEANQEALAETPAPEQIETASTDSVDIPAPENTEAEAQEAEKVKTFTQEELDAAIGKRLAREQRKWEREQAQRIAEWQAAQAQKHVADLSADQFETPEEYAEALAYKKAQELIAQRDRQREQSELSEAYHDREEEARGKYDDFEQVAYNPNLPITDVMAEAIQSSEIGPDLAYHLGSNPKEAERIARLSPFLQAKEIGKLEAKLASEPPKPTKTSSAPAPIAPVNSRSASVPSYDTTDPRSVKTMSTSEWIAAEEARMRKQLAARYNR